MLKRPVYLLVWLATAVCAAAETPPDRTHVLEVRTGWEFGPAEAPPAVERLPETWQAARPPHRLDAEPCGFYRATFAVPAAWAGYRVSLAVRPVGGTAWVWLNGQALGVRSPSALDIRLDAARAVRPGARNTVLIAVAASDEWETAGLGACWLEAAGAVTVERVVVSTWRLGQGAVVDVALDVANHSRERLEGRVELALEPDDAASNPHPVWRRGSDVRLDAGQAATIVQSFEPDPARLWRPDDPFLYRLTATVQTRDRQMLRQVVRRIAVRSVEAGGGRWQANGEWVRLAGIAFAAPGATLVCTQPGRASALAARLAPGRHVPLGELLEFCDAAGIVAFLDAPASPPETPGWRATLDALAAEGGLHPCVWGWVVEGDGEAAPAALARLRELTPRLPVGRPVPDVAADAAGSDFLVARFATRPGREDDDGYGRRLDDLVRTADGKAVVAIDRVSETADRGRVDASLTRRSREADRRWPIAALAFELDPEEGLYEIAEKRLSPFTLKPPHHEAKLDREAFVVKSRFEVQVASPVAQRLPCYSLAGCRVAWRASRDDALIASGVAPLSPAQPRAIEGGAQPGRGEIEWRTDKSGDVEFAVELQTASGRVVARHVARLSLKAKDGRAELTVR
ncbi:MAG TPA: hypothetical protein VNE39_05725 [Planctomycetota bacterium]|nr:hypothetical protein [Planctomycetota bacterium]